MIIKEPQASMETPHVDQWAREELVLVPQLYGKNASRIDFDAQGPVYIELVDGTAHTSDDQGRTWRVVGRRATTSGQEN